MLKDMFEQNSAVRGSSDTTVPPAPRPAAAGPRITAGRRIAIGLLRSCHLVPALAVTALTAGVVVLAGVPAPRGPLAVLAILCGQLSTGWSNDAIDAARDRRAGRSDKPVARGTLPASIVWVAAWVAAAAAVASSLLLGWAAALASLTVTACGWLYNVGVKATVWSWLPYAVAFGTLPAVATLALPDPTWPAAWAIAAGALLGVSAHLANVLPDLADDRATGVYGLPHRLGARWTAVGCPVLLFAGSMTILFGPVLSGAAPLSGWRLACAGVLTAVAAVAGVLGARRPAGRALFFLVLLVAAADVALFAMSGAVLT